MSRTARYKFEGFKVGDRIKAMDFQSCPDRTDRYIIGTIEEVDVMMQGAICYKVRVDTDTAAPKGYRTVVMVPYEIMLLEFNDRVTLVEEAK